MSKITILGNAYAITSTLKLEDVKALAKFHPEQLVKKDAKEVPVFAIGVASTGKGSVNSVGVSFDSADQDGFAQVTKMFPEGTKAEDRTKFIQNNSVGAAVLALNAFEAEVTGSISNLGAELAAVKDSITIAG